jgi:hypothetical protein
MVKSAKHEAALPNPGFKPLSILVGEWTPLGSNPRIPDTALHGHTRFEWLEGGAFLMMHSEINEPGIPSAIAIFGSDDTLGTLFMLIFDERGVSRQYELTLRDNTWRYWRNSPRFSQRFIRTFGDNGNTIVGVGELSKDGSTWEPDLELTYTRVTSVNHMLNR